MKTTEISRLFHEELENSRINEMKAILAKEHFEHRAVFEAKITLKMTLRTKQLSDTSIDLIVDKETDFLKLMSWLQSAICADNMDELIQQMKMIN